MPAVPQLATEFSKLAQPVPRDQFSGLPSTLEKRQTEFRDKRFKVDNLARQFFNHTESVLELLDNIMKSTKEAGHAISYTSTVRSDSPLAIPRSPLLLSVGFVSLL